ncbi:hypothetical protein F383_16088 [Gossypium arboreum]|uniref:Uncharacterized protein n=1 Tax=Gossypium arboreum TaxID=29729 RepID=A0A0B0NIL6_GOSAR|nr:hypothetical protein F383_16088 [Gossypium arboreum]
MCVVDLARMGNPIRVCI